MACPSWHDCVRIAQTRRAWARIRVVNMNSSQAMRELVRNSAGASQFDPQNIFDLPQQNRC